MSAQKHVVTKNDENENDQKVTSQIQKALNDPMIIETGQIVNPDEEDGVNMGESPRNPPFHISAQLESTINSNEEFKEITNTFS